MDTEGMVCLLNYREDGITPYFTFFKDGLKEQKLVSVFILLFRRYPRIPDSLFFLFSTVNGSCMDTYYQIQPSNWALS